MQFIPRISVTIAHEVNAAKKPIIRDKFAGISRFAIRADKVVGLVEEMDGTVYISYLDAVGRINATYIEENYGVMFTAIKDFAII